MKSKDLAILAGVLALIAVIFWQISQSKSADTGGIAAATPVSGQAPKSPAATSAITTIVVPGGQATAPAQPAPAQPTVAMHGLVLKTGDKFTTLSGLQVEILQAGSGAEATIGRPVIVNYTGTFANGTVFDSSLNPGRTSFQFVLGGHQVIAGWDEGVAGMKVGEKRKLIIPSSLAYGPSGKGQIPPNTELTFVVELLDVK